MAAPPLTHHDILALVQPFAHAGLRVDQAATDRAARRIAFRPIEHAAVPPGQPALRESLVLECLGTGTCELTRTLTATSGLQATLKAMGPQPGALLAQVQAVPAQRHFSMAPGQAVARSYALRAIAGVVQPVLTRGVVHAGGVSLAMEVSAVRGVAADLVLTPAPGVLLELPPDLPEDLLAVLGWDWARLLPRPGSWRSKLRLRGAALRRTRTAEAALERAAAHLALTLAEPPARFHERHTAARCGVVLRRAIPILTPPLLAAVVLGMPKVDVDGSPLWRLLYHLPTLLILLSFRLQELPQFEIPPWPRRSTHARWWRPVKSAAAFAGSAVPASSVAGQHG